MSESTVTSARQIPAAPYYVLTNDRFMSGWGRATGKINTIVLACRSHGEAVAVARYCRERPEQTRVRIVTRKPHVRGNVLYSLMTWDKCPKWYRYSTYTEWES